MNDPADPADTTFHRLLNREILISERRRMLILAALQALILVLILLAATFAPGFVRSIYHDRLPVRAALAAFSAFIAYELFAAGLVTIFLRRGRNYPRLRALRERTRRNELSDSAALSPRRISLRAHHRFRHVAGAALFSFHHSLDTAARFCAVSLHRSGRRGRTLRPRFCHSASRLASRGPGLEHRLSSDAQRRSSRSRRAGRFCRNDDQEPF